MSERGWRGKKDLLDVSSLSPDEINFILDCAEFFEPYSGIHDLVKEPLDICKGRTAVIVSFEPTTRTGSSSDAALKRLGGDAVVFTKAGSSMEKKESDINTILNLEAYGDILGIRGSNVREYARLVKKSVINLGDKYWHPTQALLDLGVIRKEFRRLSDLSSVYLNDLRYGRVVPTDTEALRKFPGNKFYGVPLRKRFRLPDEIRGDDYKEIEFDDIQLYNPDVVYPIRPQLNRMPLLERALFNMSRKKCFVVDEEFMKRMPEKTIVLHAQPNTGEISMSVYGHPKVKMAYQSAYGVPMRMAIYSLWLGYEDKIRELMQRARETSNAQA